MTDISEPVKLQEGQTHSVQGLSFTYSSKIPELVKATTAEGAFRWQWLLAGKVSLPLGGQFEVSDGLAVVGRSETAVHLLIRLGQEQDAYYVSGPLSAVKIEAVGSVGLLSKRPKSVVFDLGESVSIGTKMLDGIAPHGTQLLRNREADFISALT